MKIQMGGYWDRGLDGEYSFIEQTSTSGCIPVVITTTVYAYKLSLLNLFYAGTLPVTCVHIIFLLKTTFISYYYKNDRRNRRAT